MAAAGYRVTGPRPPLGAATLIGLVEHRLEGQLRGARSAASPGRTGRRGRSPRCAATSGTSGRARRRSASRWASHTWASEPPSTMISGLKRLITARSPTPIQSATSSTASAGPRLAGGGGRRSPRPRPRARRRAAGRPGSAAGSRRPSSPSSRCCRTGTAGPLPSTRMWPTSPAYPLRAGQRRAADQEAAADADAAAEVGDVVVARRRHPARARRGRPRLASLPVHDGQPEPLARAARRTARRPSPGWARSAPAPSSERTAPGTATPTPRQRTCRVRRRAGPRPSGPPTRRRGRRRAHRAGAAVPGARGPSPPSADQRDRDPVDPQVDGRPRRCRCAGATSSDGTPGPPGDRPTVPR